MFGGEEDGMMLDPCDIDEPLLSCLGILITDSTGLALISISNVVIQYRLKHCRTPTSSCCL